MPLAESPIKYLNGKSLVEKTDAIISLAGTLTELHKRGIAHRDIKLPNILYYNGRFVFTDFGLVDYPNKKDTSLKNEVIGAKWTIAPEMRRESSTADSIKADIYSFAKTMWIIFTEKTKGFDGQYIKSKVLDFQKTYPGSYIKPLEDLLGLSTSNDPNERPTAETLFNSLEKWKELNKDFHNRNNTQWEEVQSILFPTAFPKTVIWDNISDIIKILKQLCKYDNLNHMFVNSGGGMDLNDVRLSHEEDCIELDMGIIEIVKPLRLIFESFNSDSHWNYFRLELKELGASGVY